MNFGTDVEHRDGAVVVTPLGDLDMAATPAFRQTIIKVVANGDDRIVVNLASVDFCDSAGLGALVGSLKRARAHKGDLVLSSVGARLQELFRLCDLDRVFDFHDTADAAIASLSGDAP